MQWRFLGGAEAGTHVDAFGTQSQRTRHAATAADTTRCNHRNIQRTGRQRNQHHTGNVFFTGVARTLNAVDADGVYTQTLGGQRVANSDTLVDDLDSGLFHCRHKFHGTGASGFHNMDAVADNRVDIFRVGRWFDGGKYRHVYAEGLVGHGFTALDLFGQILRGRLGQTGENTQPPGIGHR